MITDKIKALFQFIEFLHSNIDNFKHYDEVINELHLLNIESDQLRPRNNFADKLKKDELQAEIKEKFKVIQDNIITPIRCKAIELNICNFQDEALLSWNGVESDIFHLKEDFSKGDIPKILTHKNKYLEFRTKTNDTYFEGFFFYDLDEILKELFDFFKESDQNEFEAFESKVIQVNSKRELIEGLHRLFGQNNPEAMETPPASIAEILEPLRGAFEDKNHIDLIIEALKESETPAKYNCSTIHINNKEFYKYFHLLHNKTDITYRKIAETLKFFIYQNNGSGNGMEAETIYQNLKRNEYKIK